MRAGKCQPRALSAIFHESFSPPRTPLDAELSKLFRPSPLISRASYSFRVTLRLSIRVSTFAIRKKRSSILNLLRSNDVPRTSRIFCPKIATFSQFQVYYNVTQAKQMTSLLLFDNFYPVTSYRRVQKEKKATNYCVRFGHSLWSAN